MAEKILRSIEDVIGELRLKYVFVFDTDPKIEENSEDDNEAEEGSEVKEFFIKDTCNGHNQYLFWVDGNVKGDEGKQVAKCINENQERLFEEYNPRLKAGLNAIDKIVGEEVSIDKVCECFGLSKNDVMQCLLTIPQIFAGEVVGMLPKKTAYGLAAELMPLIEGWERISEVAKKSGVRRNNVYNRCRLGKIEAAQVLGEWRISPIGVSQLEKEVREKGIGKTSVVHMDGKQLVATSFNPITETEYKEGTVERAVLAGYKEYSFIWIRNQLTQAIKGEKVNLACFLYLGIVFGREIGEYQPAPATDKLSAMLLGIDIGALRKSYGIMQECVAQFERGERLDTELKKKLGYVAIVIMHAKRQYES